MAAIDDLKAVVDDILAKEDTISTGISAAQSAITDEIARVEAIITALPDNPGVSDQVARLQTASSNLQAVADSLGSMKTTLDAERPAATPPPAPEPPPTT